MGAHILGNGSLKYGPGRRLAPFTKFLGKPLSGLGLCFVWYNIYEPWGRVCFNFDLRIIHENHWTLSLYIS